MKHAVSNMHDVIRANESEGRHFFSAGALRFFSSRVGSTLYSGPGGYYFITSEKFRGMGMVPDQPRRFTVRKFNPEDATIDTVGEFNKLSRSAAVRLAEKLAAGKTE